jgi:FtsZ-interacting cell division protein ZipA
MSFFLILILGILLLWILVVASFWWSHRKEKHEFRRVPEIQENQRD